MFDAEKEQIHFEIPWIMTDPKDVDKEVEYTLKCIYNISGSPTAEIVDIIRPDGSVVNNWGDEGFNDDTIDDIKLHLVENPPKEVGSEDNFPVDLTFPPKPTNLNRMEKKITISKGPKEIPHGPRHQLRRGGVMGHTGYHRPSEKDNWKKDMDMESSTAVATDVAELQNKLVQWKKPNGITLQFVVWEVGSDTVELREVIDMPHKRTKRDKVEIPRQVLQTALEAGNIEIVGTSPYGGIDEHLEVLTKIISKLFD